LLFWLLGTVGGFFIGDFPKSLFSSDFLFFSGDFFCFGFIISAYLFSFLLSTYPFALIGVSFLPLAIPLSVCSFMGVSYLGTLLG